MEEKVKCEKCGVEDSNDNAVIPFSKEKTYLCGKCTTETGGEVPDIAIQLERIDQEAKNIAQDKKNKSTEN